MLNDTITAADTAAVTFRQRLLAAVMFFFTGSNFFFRG
jgi:hypothetical protein